MSMVQTKDERHAFRARQEENVTHDFVHLAVSGNVPVAQPVVIPVDGGNGGKAQQVEYEAGEHANLGGQVVGCWREKTKISASVFVSWRTFLQKRKRGAPSFGRYAARRRSAQ